MSMIEKAIFNLSSKSYSENEIRDLLEDQCSTWPELNKKLDETLNYLKQHSIVHDQRLACETAIHYAHKGNQFITTVLKQRQVDDKHIDAAFSTIPEEMSRAWEEAEKKLVDNSHLPISLQGQVIARFLSGRQFNAQTINAVLNRLYQCSSDQFWEEKAVSNLYCARPQTGVLAPSVLPA